MSHDGPASRVMNIPSEMIRISRNLTRYPNYSVELRSRCIFIHWRRNISMVK
jgi:hypothetical protein